MVKDLFRLNEIMPRIIKTMPELDERAHFVVTSGGMGTSPLGTSSYPNRCEIGINASTFVWMMTVFPITPEVDIETKLRTMLYHESFHCQHTDNPHRANPEEERAADRHALEMMRKHYPDDFEKAVHFMRESRRTLLDVDDRAGLHSTADEIDAFAQQLRAMDPQHIHV